MDPKIHNHRTGSCIDCTDPLMDRVRGKKIRKESKFEKAQLPLLWRNSATAGKILPWFGSSRLD